MNDKFFLLPEEKQKKIIGAGYRVFALYPYNKASMSELAEEAGISKSLLFFYFLNKREYYLFLYKNALNMINSNSMFNFDGNKVDLFDEISEIMKRRVDFFRTHQYIYKFVSRVFFEKEDSLQQELNNINENILFSRFTQIRDYIYLEKLKDVNDLEKLLNIIVWSSEGFLYKYVILAETDAKKAVQEYQSILDSLKKYYYWEV